MSIAFNPGRRALLSGLGSMVCAAALVPNALATEPAPPAYVELDGHMKPLAFRMENVETGKIVTEAAFRGHPVILYFGFTRCPDTCPLTMQNAARLVRMLGVDGRKLRIAFVTVDLDYDTPARLKSFMAKFGTPPVFTGLRGTPAELEAAAKRYGVFYKAPAGPDSPDPVSAIGHSDATYLFAPDGKAVAVLTALPGSHPDLGKDAALIRKLIG
ncbi:SCO family protein [Acidiphilium sp. AL]|uniref:SCO family protein n=1 Tax=Acidiphilium sp. AL TaxID=2871704 RepID=UPI0021CB9120|nr:SCO family protein [Acidiphilium sp. AL]